MNNITWHYRLIHSEVYIAHTCLTTTHICINCHFNQMYYGWQVDTSTVLILSMQLCFTSDSTCTQYHSSQHRSVQMMKGISWVWFSEYHTGYCELHGHWWWMYTYTVMDWENTPVYTSYNMTHVEPLVKTIMGIWSSCLHYIQSQLAVVSLTYSSLVCIFSSCSLHILFPISFYMHTTQYEVA